MSSSLVSSMVLLLLVVFSLHMDGAFGAQNEIRRLKESVKKIRIVEGNENRSSKMRTEGSKTKRCGSEMATTYGSDNGQFHPLSGEDDLSSHCHPCTSYSSYCYSISCTTTLHCQSINGSPPTCTRSESCKRISGH